MKYVLFVYGDEKPWADAGAAEREAVYAQWGAYESLLTEHGARRGGNELAASATATTIRKQDGQVLITDGPFAETVEQISGYMVVEAADQAQAVEFAKAQPGEVFLRAVHDYGLDHLAPAEAPPGVRYTLLVYGPGGQETTPEQAAASAQEHYAYIELLLARGAFLDTVALQGLDTAALVRKPGVEVLITHGPFAETVEHLGGYYEIVAKDLDEAIELAKALPEPVVEVRPVVEYSG
ncbi:YciI family protein [Nonomuraea sp. NPDC050310]|uniref:YciI family protein n=1 Tax=Nonomuraea sp. NPDC050310 TaxID=3154935 RepID=UPI0033DDBFB8